MNTISALKTNFLLAIALIFFCISCGGNDLFNSGDDFSTVPEPFSTVGVTPDTTDSGLIIYNLSEGTGQLTVGIRDQVNIFYTGRTTMGEVFDSSYKNGRTSPLTQSVSGFISGMQEGLLDMREGGKRVLIIPPDLAYAGTSNSLRNDTLVFDIELDSVVF